MSEKPKKKFFRKSAFYALVSLSNLTMLRKSIADTGIPRVAQNNTQVSVLNYSSKPSDTVLNGGKSSSATNKPFFKEVNYEDDKKDLEDQMAQQEKERLEAEANASLVDARAKAQAETEANELERQKNPKKFARKQKALANKRKKEDKAAIAKVFKQIKKRPGESEVDYTRRLTVQAEENRIAKEKEDAEASAKTVEDNESISEDRNEDIIDEPTIPGDSEPTIPSGEGEHPTLPDSPDFEPGPKAKKRKKDRPEESDPLNKDEKNEDDDTKINPTSNISKDYSGLKVFNALNTSTQSSISDEVNSSNYSIVSVTNNVENKTATAKNSPQKKRRIRFKKVKVKDSASIDRLSELFKPVIKDRRAVIGKENEVYLSTKDIPPLGNVRPGRVDEAYESLSSVPVYYVTNNHEQMIFSFSPSFLENVKPTLPLPNKAKTSSKEELCTGLFFLTYTDAKAFAEEIAAKDVAAEIKYPAQKNRILKIKTTNLGEVYKIRGLHSKYARFNIVPDLMELVEWTKGNKPLLGTPVYRIEPTKGNDDISVPTIYINDRADNFKPVFFNKKDADYFLSEWKNVSDDSIAKRKLKVVEYKLEDYLVQFDNQEIDKLVFVPSKKSFFQYKEISKR